MNDGHVVCRMLGYSHALQASCCAKYGRGTGPILLDNLRCKGSESSLLYCSHNGAGVHKCKHDQDAGVMCAGIYLLAFYILKSQTAIKYLLSFFLFVFLS